MSLVLANFNDFDILGEVNVRRTCAQEMCAGNVRRKCAQEMCAGTLWFVDVPVSVLRCSVHFSSDCISTVIKRTGCISAVVKRMDGSDFRQW